MSNTRLTSKYQTTIPQDVRATLDLEAGDTIIFEIDVKERKVTLKKATPLDIPYLKAVSGTLQEWSSQNDEEDYRDL